MIASHALLDPSLDLEDTASALPLVGILIHLLLLKNLDHLSYDYEYPPLSPLQSESPISYLCQASPDSHLLLLLLGPVRDSAPSVYSGPCCSLHPW